LPLIPEALIRRGLTEEHMPAIAGGSAIGLFQQALGRPQ
jgi:hypothetical protein